MKYKYKNICNFVALWSMLILLDVAAEIKILPPKCQNAEMNPAVTLAELSNCLQAAPPGSPETCIRMCVLYNRGVLSPSGVSNPGIDSYVEETFPYHTWERMKNGLKSCSSKYQDDETDNTCSKSTRYTNCLEDIQDSICHEVAPVIEVASPPSPPPPPPPPPPSKPSRLPAPQPPQRPGGSSFHRWGSPPPGATRRPPPPRGGGGGGGFCFFGVCVG